MKEIFVALDTNILIDFYNIEHDIPNKLTSKRKNYLKIILRKIKSENLIIVRNGEQARINFVYTDTVRDELYNGFVIGKPGEIFNFLRYYNINFDTVNKKEKDLCQNILLGLMDKSKGQSIISEKNDATILSEAAAKKCFFLTSNEHHFVHDKYRNIAKLAEKTIFNLKGKTKIYCVDDFLVNFFLDEIDIEESEYHRNVIASEGAAIIQAKTADNNKTIDAFIKEQFSNSINKPEEITIGNRTYYSF